MDLEQLQERSKDALKKYWIDLVEKAKSWKIDPVIWREEEIRRAIQILSRRTKNNPVLIWEPGVWKTAIIEWIAKKIAENDIPDNLIWKKIISLDMWALLAWAMFKGEFEERFKSVIKEVEKSEGNIILFIDEIHTIVWAWNAEWQNDAWNLLKPSLARWELHLIWATTINEYRKYIEKDPALERRFASVFVDEPNRSDTLAILRWIKDKYEAHHWIKITDSAIETAVDLSIKYISDRKLPDKAIDLIDEAMSSVKLDSISKPVELDKIEKEIRTLKIELEAKKAEKISKEELEILEKNISEKQKKSDEIEKSWRFEKEILTKIKDSREKIDSLKVKASLAEREWNLWEVAKIRYWEIPELEKNISENEKKMKEIEATGKNFLKNKVEKNDIAKIIAKWTWIPASKLIESEKQKLLNLENILEKEVIWQKEAVDSVANTIRRARAWLNDESRPIWSFLFLWPTWVWKTQTAKALAKALFDDEKNMIRIDMSEYMEKHAVSRLVWAPPWYVWYEEWWQLTEAVRRKPYSVILFDEVEKAHKDVFNILLQILDDWRLTDWKWRIVNFKNTIIILTSNIWSYKIQDMTKEGKDYEEILNSLQEDLREHFRPEFLNRLDEIILFHPLGKEVILWIIENLLLEITQKLKSKNISVKFSWKIKDFLGNIWYDRDFWARPLKRAVTKYILNNISNKLIAWDIKDWDEILVDLWENKEVIVKREKN